MATSTARFRLNCSGAGPLGVWAIASAAAAGNIQISLIS
jgi:hypothetical protein